jgi:hypothetical protein
MTIALFGLWIINKHYDNAYDIEELQKKITDMKIMQKDLIEFRQSLINIDAKYKIKDEWTVNKIGKVVKIQGKMLKSMSTCKIPYKGDEISVQDVLDKMIKWEDEGLI